MLASDYKQNRKLFITLGILMFISLILGVLKLTVLKPNKITEEFLRETFYEVSKLISSDKQQRQLIADCWVGKVKAKYGNRLAEIDIDSVKNINDADIDSCAKLITKMSWTPVMEEKILKKFSSMEELNGFSDAQKMAYAKCVLSKLKLKYPAGLNGRVPQKEMDEFYMSCVEVLKIKTEVK